MEQLMCNYKMYENKMYEFYRYNIYDNTYRNNICEMDIKICNKHIENMCCEYDNYISEIDYLVDLLEKDIVINEYRLYPETTDEKIFLMHMDLYLRQFVDIINSYNKFVCIYRSVVPFKKGKSSKSLLKKLGKKQEIIDLKIRYVYGIEKYNGLKTLEQYYKIIYNMKDMISDINQMKL